MVSGKAFFGVFEVSNFTFPNPKIQSVLVDYASKIDLKPTFQRNKTNISHTPGNVNFSQFPLFSSGGGGQLIQEPLGDFFILTLRLWRDISVTCRANRFKLCMPSKKH